MPGWGWSRWWGLGSRWWAASDVALRSADTYRVSLIRSLCRYAIRDTYRVPRIGAPYRRSTSAHALTCANTAAQTGGSPAVSEETVTVHLSMSKSLSVTVRGGRRDSRDIPRTRHSKDETIQGGMLQTAPPAWGPRWRAGTSILPWIRGARTNGALTKERRGATAPLPRSAVVPRRSYQRASLDQQIELETAGSNAGRGKQT